MKRLLIFVLLACACLHAENPVEEDVDKAVLAATRVRAGQQAPDFTIKATDSTSFTLSALRGKVVVLYFFAEAAPASLTELAYLEKEVWQKLKDRGDLVVLGIARGHSREEVVQMAGKKGVTFPAAPDADGVVYGRFFDRYVPRLVVVDRGGFITHLRAGYKEFDGIVELQQAVAKALSASPK